MISRKLNFLLLYQKVVYQKIKPRKSLTCLTNNENLSYKVQFLILS